MLKIAVFSRYLAGYSVDNQSLWFNLLILSASAFSLLEQAIFVLQYSRFALILPQVMMNLRHNASPNKRVIIGAEIAFIALLVGEMAMLVYFNYS